MSKEKFLEYAYYDKVSTVSACGKLYRKDILEVSFPKGKIYEDLYIISEHIEKANRIVHTPILIYNYYKRQGSIVNSKFTAKQYDFFDAINHNRYIIKNKYGNRKNLQNAVNAKEAIGSFKISNSAYLTSFSEVTKINAILRKRKKNILLNSKINIRFKAKYVMFITSPKMFYRIKSIFRKGVDNSAN